MIPVALIELVCKYTVGDEKYIANKRNQFKKKRSAAKQVPRNEYSVRNVPTQQNSGYDDDDRYDYMADSQWG